MRFLPANPGADRERGSLSSCAGRSRCLSRVTALRNAGPSRGVCTGGGDTAGGDTGGGDTGGSEFAVGTKCRKVAMSKTTKVRVCTRY